MQKFYLGIDTTNEIIEAISKAQDYIRLAIFQMHDPHLFNILDMKLKEGVRVEICTLPYDSINPAIAIEVENRFENLKNNGAVIYFIPWNVGDPGRTSTAVGRWYSFHGKFIVTDQVAIALSANFTMANEIEAAIMMDELDQIAAFNNKFDQLISRFVSPQNDTKGTIKSEITDLIKEEKEKRQIFTLPNGIQAQTHLQYWIRHYPVELINDQIEEKHGLLLCPFDGKARAIYEYVIRNTESYVYISTESFTDVEFAEFLKQCARDNQKTIRLLTGSRSQDFNDRINAMYLDLVASGIELKTLPEPLHAKMLVTERYLVVGSVNLNKINLGFSPTARYWRSNTESIFLTDNTSLVEQAHEQFDLIFERAADICTEFARRNQNDVGEIFKSYNLRSQNEAKRILSLFIIHEKVNLNKAILRIGKFIHRLVNICHPMNQMVNMEDVIAGLILYYLSETKQSQTQLEERISAFAPSTNIHSAIEELMQNDLIELVEGSYKLNLERLLA